MRIRVGAVVGVAAIDGVATPPSNVTESAIESIVATARFIRSPSARGWAAGYRSRGLTARRPEPRLGAMFVCLCLAISDRVIVQEIEAGARTVRDLREGCGAGSICSGCRSELIALLREHADESLERKG